MIRLAFSTNAFKKDSLEDAVNHIADIGYRGVEIMADRPHAYPPDMPIPRRTALKRQLASRGLEVSNVNAFTLFAQGDTYHPTWIEDDQKLRRARIDHTLQCLDLTAQLGAKTISLQPGGPLIGTRTSSALAQERFAEGLSAILPHARQLQITLCIEPEPGLLIETAQEYLAFKQRFFSQEPLVRMNCDIGHLFCVGEDPAEVIRAMPEQVAHVHLEDIGDDRVHQHLLPGRGVINFSRIFEALDNVRYSGWVTVELYPYESTAARTAQLAWDHLKGLGVQMS